MKKFIALAVAALVMAGSASATTVTFENFANGQSVSGAGGLSSWANLYALNAATYGSPGSYDNAIVSGSMVTYNSGGGNASISNGSNFTFNSGYFTAVWVPQVDMQIRGYDDGVLKYSMDAVINHTPTNLLFNWTGVDNVTFASFQHGTPYQTWFSMDDVVVNNAVPEPASVALLGLGLAGLVASRRRKSV